MAATRFQASRSAWSRAEDALHDDVQHKAAVKEPQPWDTEKVAIAFADAQEIVEACEADNSGDTYREVLARLMALRLDGVVTTEELSERLAYVFYGFALFGLGGLATAEAHSGLSRQEVLALIGSSLDRWLDENS
jgi:hypothetical protein